MTNSFFELVYQVVRCIPPGKVATYGQVARILGKPRGARTVGWALHSMPEGSDVPWQRVLNARGIITLDAHGPGGAIQRALLEAEGIAFDEQGRIDFQAYGWSGLDLVERDRLLGPSDDR
jgi:methylated-DNA-protein-cysteine methyltransferase-like protein